ncbi:hypothetical protein [Streptomyces collinus]|uniref:hypothetical protein n=1 Tax=Streptomyces collinus TaxID=42684 RepID=UPI0038063A5A
MASTDGTTYRHLFGAVWRDRIEADIYHRVVEACLEEPDIAKRLNKRPAANAEAVRAAMAAESNALRSINPTQEELIKLRAAVAAVRSIEGDQEARLQDMHLDWKTVSLGALVITTFMFRMTMGASSIFWFTAATALAVFALTCAYEDSRRTLVRALTYAACVPVCWIRAFDMRVAGSSWESELRAKGVRPLLRRIIDALLGDDPDELLLAESYDGLRTTASLHYLVESSSAEQLAHKMGQMDGGTIAVCGPRGSGKTTLLEGCIKDNDFSVFVSAPATFAPQDFLTSLFAKLCQQYMEAANYRAPNFARLTTTQRALQRVSPRIKRFLAWAAYAIPAFILVALGTFATIRTLKERHEKLLQSHVQHAVNSMCDVIFQVWQGQAPVYGLLVTLLGIFIWKHRKSDLWSTIFATLKGFAGFAVGASLTIYPVISLALDPDTGRYLRSIFGDSLTVLALIVIGLAYIVTDPVAYRGVWRLGRMEIEKKEVMQSLRIAWPIGAVCGALVIPALREFISDSGNPTRVLSLLAGYLIFKLSDWKPRSREPVLVTRCRSQLYRLQTVQSTTSTLNTSTSQVLSVGSSHATSVTTVPPNFPEVVAEFRDLLSDVAFSCSVKGKRTIIAIDELDRLGNAAEALEFLNEIKAIFGVPKVYYLVSVAEDVGAAFVRRGLPYRDATDSSLDDVVNVQPGTLKQSTRILRKRAPGISSPYVGLVHSLSGGIPRDLVRYGRRVVETEAKTGMGELAQIARQLIVEELLETLSGFRILLSKQQWDESASPALESFRRLMRILRSEEPDMQELHRDLSEFSEGRWSLGGEQVQMSTETSHLLLEASCYAYFSLTMLDVFGSEGFTRRSRAAAFQEDGDLQLLAEARQELAMSPYTARALLRSIRRAWNLPVAS